MTQNWRSFETTSYSYEEPYLDDAEPQWESIGYLRDLRQPQPTTKKSPPELPDALVARSLPILDNQMDAEKQDDWNVKKCDNALYCNDPACPNFHQYIDRSCKKCVQLGKNRGCQFRESSCTSDLHAKNADVCRTYVLKLMNTNDSLIEAAQQLEAKSIADRATYNRIVVWDFATVRMRALRYFLERLPLVRELHLPDSDYCPFHLLALLELMNRHLYKKCPSLRWLVFRDGWFAETCLEETNLK